MADRKLLIDYYKSRYKDLIPYDDPQYEEKLQRDAEEYADCVIREELEYIEERDRWLKENELDFDSLED
jgi:hypothetical protein